MIEVKPIAPPGSCSTPAYLLLLTAHMAVMNTDSRVPLWSPVADMLLLNCLVY